MSNQRKKRVYVVELYHEHREDREVEKVVAIGTRMTGEIYDNIQFSNWAKKRLDQAVEDVRWLQYLSTRFIDTPKDLEEMLRGL